MKMKHKAIIFAVLAASLLCVTVRADDKQSPQEQYISKWAPTAVSEMYRSGVPASITLAQGLLESRYGLSELASKGNNHFGIKCHKDWKGKSMKVDDDAKNECFRVYSSAEESFRDHSDFLRYRDRYKSLFDLKTTDYKSWAYGLKKAGYATDPSYATKLIKLVEDYKLYEYDKMTVETASLIAAAGGTETVSEMGRELTKQERKAAKKAARKAAKERDMPESQMNELPPSPLSIEEPERLNMNNTGEAFSFKLKREAYSQNGVPFVTSVEGETYSSIAAANDLYLKEILKFNDLRYTRELLPGTVVYLQPKKKQAEKGLDKHIVGEDDGTLRDICQRYAVKMSSIMKLNGFGSDYEPQEGDTIKLRK